MGYTLRLSVKVQAEAPIQGLDAEPSIVVDGITVTVKKDWPWLIFVAQGFESEDAAEDFVKKLKLALYSLALKYHIAFRSAFSKNKVHYLDRQLDPSNRHDGRADADGYCIYPNDKKISFWILNPGRGSGSTGWSFAEEALRSGLVAEPPAIDDKTATAIELYLETFHEASNRARFLTLIMALEIMAPRPKRHDALIAALGGFREKLEFMKQGATEVERREVQGVLSQIGFSEEQSINLRIQQLIRDEAPLEQDAREALARKMKKAYDIRSKIMHHGGNEEVMNVFDDVLTAVKLVLSARLGLSSPI
ncbi:HEPN domain-containing protein [Roseicella sp. DB1501]|uniref:HEPN domain-containing protein n=1 Tax=Roseicella sp. DB1501 TaxID=2730925 RepID=UPI001492DBF7|nr:HEPN domain-containing protein [Roseicella sp. DB1501]NOG73753.1 hypothetical protein [Roseicella sp. DB1501]